MTPVILDVDDLHLVEIDDGEEVGHRAGVAVVGGMAPHPGQRADQAAPLLAREAEVPGRPRVDHGEAEIGDAALAHGLLPARIGAHRGLALEELVEDDRRLDAGHGRPREHALLGQRDDRLVGRPGRVVEQDREGLALDGRARLVAQHHVLGRLVQGDGDHPRARPRRLLGPDQRPGAGDLVGAEGVERVARVGARVGRRYRHRALLAGVRGHRSGGGLSSRDVGVASEMPASIRPAAPASKAGSARSQGAAPPRHRIASCFPGRGAPRPKPRRCGNGAAFARARSTAPAGTRVAAGSRSLLR